MQDPVIRKYTAKDYWSLPEGRRAELIDGELYDMAAPSRRHQRLLGELYKTIDRYITDKGGKCEVNIAPFTVQLFSERDDYVEPDICVICDPDKITEKGCVGAPDWIIEITSPGNTRHDYEMKFRLYEEAGVREYWIVDPAKGYVIVYHLSQKDESRQPFSTIYTFSDKIPVDIYDDLTIDFAMIDSASKGIEKAF